MKISLTAISVLRAQFKNSQRMEYFVRLTRTSSATSVADEVRSTEIIKKICIYFYIFKSY